MRVDYWSLPPELHAALTTHFGAEVTSATTQHGGFSGGVAVRLGLADGRTAFVKGCPADHPIRAQYEVEGWFGTKLRHWPALPAPELSGRFRAAGWFVLVFADIDGHDAELTDSDDLTACLVLFDQLTAQPYPDAFADRIPPVAVALGHLASGWRRLADDVPDRLDPWVRENLSVLRDLEARWPAAAAGRLPVHTDLHPGNVLVRQVPGGREALAVDWTRPAVGAAWVDPLLFCLRDPAVTELPAWFRERYALPRPALCAFLAGAAGHWADAARLEAPAYAPGLRAYEAARAAKALDWLRRELEDAGP